MHCHLPTPQSGSSFSWTIATASRRPPEKFYATALSKKQGAGTCGEDDPFVKGCRSSCKAERSEEMAGRTRWPVKGGTCGQPHLHHWDVNTHKVLVQFLSVFLKTVF